MTAYYYVVRSVNSPVIPGTRNLIRRGVGHAEGPTPPARPTGLTAVPGVTGVSDLNENKERTLPGTMCTGQHEAARTTGGGRTSSYTYDISDENVRSTY
jgi:hypothetical protein